MAYTYPNKAADFEEGGDGYDLETLFTGVNRGVTCTYDDLIFMPGRFGFELCCDVYHMIDFRNGS